MPDLSDNESIYPKEYKQRLQALSPEEQEAVKKFWRSVVMRSQRAFSEENGRLPCATSVRSCNCCPYGYHIDLDFVRYCESLANAKPTEEQLRRRSRRRSRKSMEFMLGLESLFDQWDAAERVQMVPEAPLEREPESPRIQPPTHTSTPYANHNNNNNEYKPQQQQQRANSVPRFTYGGLSRSESPFATSSSTCSSVRGTDVDSTTPPFPQRRPTNSPPETRAFLHDALDEVCSDFERTLERASTKRKKAPVGDEKGGGGGGVATMMGSDRNNNYTIATSSLSNGKRTCHTWEEYVDALDSCVSGNKSPRSSRSFTRSATLPLPPSPHKQRPNPAQQQYESYVKATVAANAAQSALDRVPPPPPPRRHVLSGQTPKLLSPTPDRERDGNSDVSSSLASPLGVVTDGSLGGGSGTDAQTLFNIRQQMALSLKRMKDLEEQVKTIPELQSELTQLRDEKQRLQSTLQRKDDELQRARESSRLSSTPSPVASLKQASPVQFMPQRISPISLESLGARLRTNSTSSERQLKASSASPATVLKRDVGVMCGQRQATRDIAVGSPTPAVQRSVGTSPAIGLDEELFTHRQLVAHVERALQTHEAKTRAEQERRLAEEQQRRKVEEEQRRMEEEERRRIEEEERRRMEEERRKMEDERRRVEEEKRNAEEEKRKAEEEQRRRARLISVGTQMFVPKRELRDSAAQTPAERPPSKYSVAVTAQPTTRENFVSCRPDVRTVGCSESRVDDVLCEKCATPKRSIACGTDEIAAEASAEAGEKKKLSLRLLDAGRSNTFSLGEHDAPPLKRKSVGTQATPPPAVVHSVAQQTSAPLVHAVGVQHAPRLQTTASQAVVSTESRQTETRGLIRLCATQTSTEEIATPMPEPPPKPAMRSSASMTDVVRTVEHGVNTLPPPAPTATRHTGSNTEAVRTRDMACGDAVKPHISIACADNYCDSCKDAIRHLAKDFTKAQPTTSTVNATPTTPPASTATPPSPVASRAADSRIPRPTHLASPSPVRKKFQRQNTYTITPSPTPSPVAEKKNLLSSLSEKSTTKPSDSDPESSMTASNDDAPAAARPPRPRQPSVSETRAAELDAVFSNRPPKTYELSHSGLADGPGELIVKEETRVSISWSRDASPAPLSTSFKETTPSSSTPLTRSAESQRASKSSSPEQQTLSKGATSKQLASDTATPISSQSDVTATTDETVVEVPLRERIQPSKEMLSALKTVNESLRKPSKSGSKSPALKSAQATVQKEWFRIASTEESRPDDVDDYLVAVKDISVPLLEHCVNMTDSNGNTAMHYAVSHGNFEIVSSLLDSKVCNVNQMNNAGYTCVMLVTLAKLENALHRSVVQRLFQMADVNIRAKKHCQTALMLAVSHGNLDMVEMLLTAGADINLQDEDGSTALMCAAEHGRVDIVKHLLSQPDCDSLVQDVDGSTAFKIAWHAGHRDIGLLLYVHEQMLRSKMPNKGDGSRTPSLSPRHHKRQPSQ